MRSLRIVFALLFLSGGPLVAQSQLKMALKDSTSVDYYLDGERVDFKIARLLDAKKIQSVSVLKDKASLEKYNAKVGVVLITSAKSFDGQQSGSVTVKVNGADGTPLSLQPMFIIDGEEADREMISALDPNDLKDISVVKGEAAIRLYNAPNGVVLVTTKKGKKKKKK